MTLRVAVAIIAFIGSAALTLGAGALAPSADLLRAQPQPPAPTTCVATPGKVAAPAEIPLGATVDVTLTLALACPPEPAPLDVVLAVDQSSSMADNNRMVNARAAALAFLDATDFKQTRVAVIAFGEVASVFAPLTSDRAPLEAAIRRLTPGGRTNISAAIDLARETLDADVRSNAARAMVVLTDGQNTAPGALPVADAAARAHAAGITVVAICAGGTCADDLARAASAPRFYYSVPDTTQLTALYRDLASTLQAVDVVAITVTDEIPANMRYVAGSARPAPARIDGSTLVWEFAAFPAAGIRYTLEPLAIGTWPTNVAAVATFVDRLGRRGEAPFPVPQLHVTGVGTATPTPTIADTPTPVATATPSATPTATPRPTRTPRVRYRPLYLPLALSPCRPIQPRVEIVFLIDNSSCLDGSWSDGMDAIDAIYAGIDAIMGQLALPADRVAVVAFGDRAVLLQSMTADRAAVRATRERIVSRDSNARLDRGIAVARAELTGPNHRPGSRGVIVFITDGPMGLMPGEAIIAQADAARAQDIAVWGIGFNSPYYDLLTAVADPGKLITLNGYGIVDAYRTIGDRTIIGAAPCPAGWPLTPAATATPPATPTPTG